MVKNVRVALIVLGLCVLLVSCGSTKLDVLEVNNGTGNPISVCENSESNDLRFEKLQYERFTISLANIDPILTREQICQPQRTSFCAHQLNTLADVYLSDVDLSGRQLLILRINNGSCSTLYHPFFRRPPSVILEKNIAGYWYEVPHLMEEPPTTIRQIPIVTLPISANESSISLAVDLNYWRLSEAGLYRLIFKVSFNSDFTQPYFLSETLEIQEAGIKYSEEQVNKGVFLTFTEYDYTEDVLLGVVKNKSESKISSPGWRWRMEKYVAGCWINVPVNSMAPGGRQWQGGVFADTDALLILNPGQELDISVRLGYWHPLSLGTYRMTLVLFGEREIIPVNAVFEIID